MSDQPKPTTGPTIPGPDADPIVAWSRVQQYLDKLADALYDLDEAGGIAGAAEAGNWRPGRIDAARVKFRAMRDQLDAGLARLKGTGSGRR